VALGCSTPRSGSHLNTFHQEPYEGPAPLQGSAPPLLNGPFLVQGFSEGLSVPVHDAPSLKRLLLPLDLCPQLPIALGGEPLHPLWRIEGGPLQRQLVILQLGVTGVDGSNFGRLKSVLIQECLGTLLVIQERNNLFIDLRVQVGDENEDAATSSRPRGAFLAEVHGTPLVQSRDQGQVADAAQGNVCKLP